MKFKELVQESFTTAYPVEMVSDRIVQFSTDSGNTYYFQVKPLQHGRQNKTTVEEFGLQVNTTDLLGFEFFFSAVTEDKITNKYNLDSSFEEDNPLKVFSTVVKLLEKYVESSDPDFVVFEGEQNLGRLYRRMAQRLIQQYPDYTVQWSEEDNLTKFLAIKKDLIS